MADDNGQERTEKATPKRMKEVRKDGSLAKSQDLSAWLGVGAAVVMLPMAISRGGDAAHDQMVTVRNVIQDPDPARVLGALSDGLGSVLVTLTPVLIVVVLAAIIANAAQGGIHIAGKKLKPSFKQFNVVNGLKRTFGTQALWQGVKTVLKTGVVGLVLFMAVKAMVPTLMTAGGLSMSTLLSVAAGGINNLTRGAIAAGIGLAIMDVIVVMRRNRKKTRMTKKEIKDENKQTEGDPQLKGAIRSRQIATSRNRMLASVADADVVLVNPTRVAVALTYAPGQGAPRVVATGKGHIAAQIRERAAEHHIPMVQDIPLARAVHSVCRVGEEIPAELYNSVAQVLAFVMALKRRGAAQGKHTMAAASDIPDLPDHGELLRRAREARSQSRTDKADAA